MKADGGVVDRLEAVRGRLRHHADAELDGLTDPEPGTGERWDAGQVWAHLAEFPSYWLAQARDVVERAAAGDPPPIPFGRTKSDPARLGAIERDRREDPRALLARASDGIDAVAAALAEWSPAQRAVRGQHTTLGEMPVSQILEHFVVEHLEEHADQLDALATQTNGSGSVMDRIIAFCRGIEERSSTRLLDASVGTLLLNDDYPLSYSHNFLRVEGGQPALTAEGLDAEARRLLRDAGRSHLQVVVEEEATARRLAPGMRSLGWSETPLIYMALTGEPSVPSPARAEVVPWDAVRPLVEEDFRNSPETRGTEVVRQLTERREAIARATHLRHVAAPAGGPYQARADLYSDGRTMQIESVVTLAQARNRGLARAVVLEAARVAREEGLDLVFLVAEEDDWPKALYARLGFEIVGRSSEFARD